MVDLRLYRRFTRNLGDLSRPSFEEEFIMAKRGFDTSFWTDTYIMGLPPYEKLAYCYLINYPLGNIAGIFEYDPRRFSFELSIPEEALLAILDRLERDGKICRFGGKVAILNWCRYQAINPPVLIGIKRELTTLSIEAIQRLKEAGYRLPRGWSWPSIEKAVQKANAIVEDLDPMDSLPPAPPTSLHYTSLNLTSSPAEGGGEEEEILGGEEGTGAFVLSEAQLDTLDKDFPDLVIDDEYEKAKAYVLAHGIKVSDPFRYLKSYMLKGKALKGMK